jgi:molybdopterin/thiamine biosynthesis adenylyltransferase
MVKMWSKFYREMTVRNIGVLCEEEQERLRSTTIAVAGSGGMGGLSALLAARSGFGGIRVADPDNFEILNITRQFGATISTLGKKKAAVISKEILDINPEVRITSYLDGVQPENVSEFLEGVDVVIDGIDYTQFWSSVVLHREAKKLGLCVINPQAVGFGVSVLVFGPKTVSIEEYVGLQQNATKEEVEGFTIPIQKFVPYLPPYVDQMTAVAAASGKIPIPNIMTMQALGTAIAVSEAQLLLLGRIPEPEGPQPRIFVQDLQTREFQVND